MVKTVRILLLISLACTIVACSKRTEDKPKTSEQTQVEKAAAEKTVRDNPVYGEQIKALDKAKETQKAMDALAAEHTKKIDDVTK